MPNEQPSVREIEDDEHFVSRDGSFIKQRGWRQFNSHKLGGTGAAEFTGIDDGKLDSLTMTPREMLPLLEFQQATIHVRDGAFGWSWIERIEPRRWSRP